MSTITKTTGNKQTQNPTEIQSEDDVRKFLSDWITSTTDFNVHWAENVSEDYPFYRVTPASGRPDLLVENGEKFYLVEVKDARDSSNVYDGATEAHSYWCDSEPDLDDRNSLTVKFDGRRVRPDGVFLATQFSQQGHLFKRSREGSYRQTYQGEMNSYNPRPKHEFARTEAVPRMMWRQNWEIAERFDLLRNEIEVSTGVLLSDCLDEDLSQDSLGDSVPDPMLLGYGGVENTFWRGF